MIFHRNCVVMFPRCLNNPIVDKYMSNLSIVHNIKKVILSCTKFQKFISHTCFLIEFACPPSRPDTENVLQYASVQDVYVQFPVSLAHRISPYLLLQTEILVLNYMLVSLRITISFKIPKLRSI